METQAIKMCIAKAGCDEVSMAFRRKAEGQLEELESALAAARAEVERLNLLVSAVSSSEFGGVFCFDVDGMNWFDARKQAQAGKAVG